MSEIIGLLLKRAQVYEDIKMEKVNEFTQLQNERML